MKIGILTYHRSINYGAFMQSFVLSQRLKELPGVEVEIIDYMSKRMDRYYKLFTLYRGKSGVIRIVDRIKMYNAFCKSMEALPISNSRLVSDDIRKFDQFIEGKYDLIVVGSDAVWNYEKRGLPNPYFLINQREIHKFSYAASCNGIHLDALNEEKINILKHAFDKFEYLGVRDEITEFLIWRTLGNEIGTHNCDPTFLLDFEKDGLGEEFKEALLRKLERKYKWNTKKKHIGLMLSNYNGDLAKILVDKLKKKYGEEYEIVSIYSYCKYADIRYISDLTPFEWSRIFSLFDITFSKYFHGTLFSIINKVPVISLSVEESQGIISSKVEDVLKRLDLMEFYYPGKSANDIEWKSFLNNVDKLLNEPPIKKMVKNVKKEKKYSESFFDKIKELNSR